jgi:hypothetical protein
VTEKLPDERGGMDCCIGIARMPFGQKAEECPADRLHAG